MWDDLVRGAIGAVVLVDTRRLADSFPAIDYFEEAKLPFVIGINGWDGQFGHGEDDVREALSLELAHSRRTPGRSIQGRGQDHADHPGGARADPPHARSGVIRAPQRCRRHR